MRKTSGKLPELPDTESPDADFAAPEKRGRKPLPAHLPRERVEYDLPEDQKVCVANPLQRIGDETTVQLFSCSNLGGPHRGKATSGRLPKLSLKFGLSRVHSPELSDNTLSALNALRMLTSTTCYPSEQMQWCDCYASTGELKGSQPLLPATSSCGAFQSLARSPYQLRVPTNK